jgi:hypothetical protein
MPSGCCILKGDLLYSYEIVCRDQEKGLGVYCGMDQASTEEHKKQVPENYIEDDRYISKAGCLLISLRDCCTSRPTDQ